MRRTLALFLALASCSKLTAPPAPEPIASDTPVTAAAEKAPTAEPTRGREHPPTPPGPDNPAPKEDVKIDDVVVGKGAEVHMGDTVTVHYTGTLTDGTKFDSSHDHPDGQPMTTRIPGRLIPGWNRGIPGMKVGGRRKLTIPPSLGYGTTGQPPKIPPNATLLFDIELVDVKPSMGAPSTNLMPRPQPNHP